MPRAIAAAPDDRPVHHAIARVAAGFREPLIAQAVRMGCMRPAEDGREAPVAHCGMLPGPGSTIQDSPIAHAMGAEPRGYAGPGRHSLPPACGDVAVSWILERGPGGESHVSISITVVAVAACH